MLHELLILDTSHSLFTCCIGMALTEEQNHSKGGNVSGERKD